VDILDIPASRTPDGEVVTDAEVRRERATDSRALAGVLLP